MSSRPYDLKSAYFWAVIALITLIVVDYVLADWPVLGNTICLIFSALYLRDMFGCRRQSWS